MLDSLVRDLPGYDASGLADAIASGRYSAVEVMNAHLARIDELNERYNAIVTVDRTGAVARAKEADREIARGRPLGRLHGVPITIKDAIDVAGMRCTVGHRRFKDVVAAQDAWAVERLKREGAIVVGKTNCASLCCDVQTSNELFGKTRNPWDEQRTSGGSSGGEAVALALGMSALGLGSDTAGSVRIPASYCGIYALKPTIGRIERSGLRPTGVSGRCDSLTVVGPMARSIRDLNLTYEILSDESSQVSQVHADSGIGPPRVLWTQRFAGIPIADEVVESVDAARLKLESRDVAVRCVEEPLDFKALNEHYRTLCLYEFLPKDASPIAYYGLWSMEFVTMIANGGADRRYRALKRMQAELSERFERWLTDGDCWALPATPSVAFTHRLPNLPVELRVDGANRRCRYWHVSAGLTAPISLLGNPSVVVPVGRNAHGLPVAIQLVGKRGEDRKLLRTAAYLHEKLNMTPHGSVPENAAAVANVLGQVSA